MLLALFSRFSHFFICEWVRVRLLTPSQHNLTHFTNHPPSFTFVLIMNPKYFISITRSENEVRLVFHVMLFFSFTFRLLVVNLSDVLLPKILSLMKMDAMYALFLFSAHTHTHTHKISLIYSFIPFHVRIFIISQMLANFRIEFKLKSFGVLSLLSQYFEIHRVYRFNFIRVWNMPEFFAKRIYTLTTTYRRKK